MPRFYGSTNGQAKEIKTLYGPVAGQTKKIKKLYASVNGQTKLIYQEAVPSGMGIVTYYTDSSHTSTAIGTIQDQAELNSLGGSSSSYSVTIGGVSVPQSNIKEVSLNSNVATIPTNFLYYCDYLETLDISQSSIINIPDNFMATEYNTALPLTISAFPPTLLTIGQNFLFMNFRVNQNFSLPSSLTSIGKAFMAECRQMIGVISCDCPASIVVPDASGAFFETLAMGINTAPAYATGIRLTGTYANDWHTTFPDKSSGLYRKTTVS